jgi:hypothetical protein
MGAPRRKIWASAVLVALFGGSGGSIWLQAQNSSLAARTAAALRARRASVTSGERGATYDWLEAKATRVTTRFADAAAIAERGADGRVTARIVDLSGNEVATLRVGQMDAENDVVDFAAADGTAARTARRPEVRSTLDWSNQQAYSMWKDGRSLRGTPLEWQDMLVRPRGAKRRDLAGESVQTDTEWAGGFSATVTRKIATHVSAQTGQKVTGLVLVSRFKRDGVEVGSSQWWPQEQTFGWSFPGLTEGYIDAARLEGEGGWPFLPDMAWLNTQSLAFYEFHTALNTGGAVSERRGGWLERIGAYVAPRLMANEPGCDGLHWLDQSMFRPCCDAHDRCYAKAEPACGAESWWQWWSGWQCNVCNIYAVLCFTTGGGSHVFFRTP